jgi:hypothetical protein
MKRRVHLEVLTCAATEADPEGETEIACGTQADFEVEHLTPYSDHVTCKRCLKRMQTENRPASRFA